MKKLNITLKFSSTYQRKHPPNHFKKYVILILLCSLALIFPDIKDYILDQIITLML